MAATTTAWSARACRDRGPLGEEDDKLNDARLVRQPLCTVNGRQVTLVTTLQGWFIEADQNVHARDGSRDLRYTTRPPKQLTTGALERSLRRVLNQIPPAIAASPRLAAGGDFDFDIDNTKCRLSCLSPDLSYLFVATQIGVVDVSIRDGIVGNELRELADKIGEASVLGRSTWQQLQRSEENPAWTEWKRQRHQRLSAIRAIHNTLASISREAS